MTPQPAKGVSGMVVVDQHERLIYCELLRAPGSRPNELADRLHLTPDDVVIAVAGLKGHGLLTIDPGGGLRAAAPQHGMNRMIEQLESVAAHQRDQAATARAQAADLLAEYQRHRPQVSAIELPSFSSSVERCAELCSQAQHRLGSIIRMADDAAGTVAVRPETVLAALRRGVVVRELMADGLHHRAATTDRVRRLVGHGGKVRTLPAVPLQLLLIDSAALFPADPSCADRGMIEIRGPAVVAAFTQLFEGLWNQANPADLVGAVEESDIGPDDTDPVPHVPAGVRWDGSGLSGRQLELLRLLADGYTDAAAARRLQLSVRTVQRLMADLTVRLDAQSRFEVAAKAAARGWI